MLLTSPQEKFFLSCLHHSEIERPCEVITQNRDVSKEEKKGEIKGIEYISI